jgi:hypothetical protein
MMTPYTTMRSGEPGETQPTAFVLTGDGLSMDESHRHELAVTLATWGLALTVRYDEEGTGGILVDVNPEADTPHGYESIPVDETSFLRHVEEQGVSKRVAKRAWLAIFAAHVPINRWYGGVDPFPDTPIRYVREGDDLRAAIDMRSIALRMASAGDHNGYIWFDRLSKRKVSSQFLATLQELVATFLPDT